MVGYGFMYMEMIGNRDGNHNSSTGNVLQNYMITPTEMTMEMHMFHLMYAPSDDLTLMAMLSYKSLSMDHKNRSGARLTTDSSGPGDLKVTALYTVFDSSPHRIHLDAGVSLPTGSINEKDNTPAGSNQKLPYPRQLGSGTFDLHPGVSYLGQSGRLGWGAHAGGVLRLGDNSENYRLGNRLDFSAWGGYKLSNWLSSYVRVDS
jgi:hypothetical protein